MCCVMCCVICDVCVMCVYEHAVVLCVCCVVLHIHLNPSIMFPLCSCDQGTRSCDIHGLLTKADKVFQGSGGGVWGRGPGGHHS